MFGLIIKAMLVSFMWFATGISACASAFCKADEDDYNFRKFRSYAILNCTLALIDTVLLVLSVYPG